MFKPASRCLLFSTVMLKLQTMPTADCRLCRSCRLCRLRSFLLVPSHCLPRSKISTSFGRWRDQRSQKIVLLPIASKFGPQEVSRFSQLCAKFQALGSFELHATIFSNLVKMALPSGRILSRLLRRMKAFIDEFRPNTSQANYFRGFWRITSEINAKIEVIKQ